eukprot:5455398-Amphidinium_carterae.1
MSSCPATSLAQALSGLNIYRNYVHVRIVLYCVVIHFVRALCHYLTALAGPAAWNVRQKTPRAAHVRMCFTNPAWVCAGYVSMATTTLSGVVTSNLPLATLSSDAGHLDALNVMDYEDNYTTRQVLSPSPEGNQPDRVAERSLTLTSQEQQQKVQGISRTIAQRTKLRMSVEGGEEMSLRRRVDLLTLELEKAQFETKTESRTHHEQFQQRMRNEAKRMCAYVSEERTRVFRETQQRYEGLVADLRRQVDHHKLQFREELRETVENEVKSKSDQIAELQERMRHNNHDEVVQLREQLELERAN